MAGCEKNGDAQTNEEFKEPWKAYNLEKDLSWTPETSTKPVHPPYDENVPSYKVNSKEGQKFVRLVPGEPEWGLEIEDIDLKGRWLMRKEDYEAIMAGPDSAKVFKEQFALPEMPAIAAIVKLPANTKLRVGIASPHAKWGQGGSLQFEIIGELDHDWFTDSMQLIGANK